LRDYGKITQLEEKYHAKTAGRLKMLPLSADFFLEREKTVENLRKPVQEPL